MLSHAPFLKNKKAHKFNKQHYCVEASNFTYICVTRSSRVLRIPVAGERCNITEEYFERGSHLSK